MFSINMTPSAQYCDKDISCNSVIEDLCEAFYSCFGILSGKVKRMDSEEPQPLISHDNDKTSVIVKNTDNDYVPRCKSVCLVVSSDLHQGWCRFCGSSVHPRNCCPARKTVCNFCKYRGHLPQMCERRAQLLNSNESYDQKVLALSTAPSLSSVMVDVYVNGKILKALIDTGSCQTFINQMKVQALNLTVFPGNQTVTMASSTKTNTTGLVKVELAIGKQVFDNQPILILPNMTFDMIIGHDGNLNG